MQFHAVGLNNISDSLAGYFPRIINGINGIAFLSSTSFIMLHQLNLQESPNVHYIRRPSNSHITLLRFLNGSDGDQQELPPLKLMGAVKVWENNRSEVVNSSHESISEEALGLLSDA